jgi:O-antigen/teichoic acid export membrane protein
MLLITFAITSIFLWLPKATYKDRSDEIQFREFKAYVFPAAAVSISSIMVARLDQMLLPLQATSEEVGYYAIAVTFAEVPSIFTLLVSRAALQSSSVGDSFSIQIRKTRFYIFLGLLLISVLSMISFPVIIHVFGPAFEPSYSIILVLMLSSTLSLPNALIISSLCGSGNVLKAALVSSSALLPIVAGFIVSWGRINGYQAAWITFQSQFLILILGIFFVLRKRYQVA